MIVMNSETFALRLFKIHLEHCKRIQARTSTDWSFKLWTESEVKAIQGFNNEIYESIDSEDGRKDYLKLLLLREYGGVMIDTSYVCLKDHSVFNRYR